ncbi:MAG: hypothetical protein M3Z04_02680, partial [Chloroflexota bacterium]|nr:hypothetical protein [Chloroflexota bacterium]
MQAKGSLGRLSCSIVVGLLGALVLLGSTVGFLGGRSSSRPVGAIAPTQVAAAPTEVAAAAVQVLPTGTGSAPAGRTA